MEVKDTFEEVVRLDAGRNLVSHFIEQNEGDEVAKKCGG